MTNPPSSDESSSASPTPTEDLTLPPDPKASRVRVVGVVTEGVERGCLMLASAGVLYLLLGARPAVGSRVEVVGTIDRGAMSTCQQGLPLRVEQVTEQ